MLNSNHHRHVLVALAASSLVGLVFVACSDTADDVLTGTDSGTDAAASIDANHPSDSSPPAVDAGRDSSAVDAGPDVIDAGPDVVDAGPDVVDAGLDVIDAGPDVIDAGPDVIDAGPDVIDAGKPVCLGVFCLGTNVCCKNSASVDYGKCAPPQPNGCK